ncbi:TolC family protein [Gemmata sp. G18]|uniref:TolC family protein n=1 Tax=Gemmata palustris TaxID=2822762 RepID=A0ABS5BU78_9BACT|nr:TolC family protein [Gemmata palustris]MBP3956428.1 TolC family protein [Gemmata palustris]
MQLPARTPKLAVRLLAGLAPLSFMVGATLNAQPKQNPLPAPAPVPVQPDAGKNGADKYADVGPELSLAECIAIALERQPSLKAVKESAAATEAGYRALSNFGTASTLISPDVEIRKQQAKRGLMATSAEYQKLHNEVVQDVTRLYYNSVYAKQQLQLADRVVFRIATLVAVAEAFLKETPAKDLGDFNLGKLQFMQSGLLDAKKLQASARIGRQKALAGLREVMSVDARTFPFQVKDKELPIMSQKEPLTSDRVVELALERRPELVLAAAGVDAFRLEVYAQGKIPFKRVVPTLASGADIKAKEIPQANRGTDYRPGGIIPEMPAQLVGSKFDRVCRAMAFARRAESVYEKAYYLIKLEAQIAYFDFEVASERLAYSILQFKLSKEIQENARASAEIVKSKDQLVQAEVIAARAQSEYVEAVYQYLLALAALERVTAGGIHPEFPDR